MLSRLIDPTVDALRLDLTRRDVHDDNPARRFSVQQASFISVSSVRKLLADFHPQYSEAQLLEVGGFTKEDYHVIGHLQVVCVCDATPVLFYIPMYLYPPEFEALQRTPQGRLANLRAIKRLTDGIERGKVLIRLARHKATASSMCAYGEMHREKKMWTWRECPPGESELRL